MKKTSGKLQRNNAPKQVTDSPPAASDQRGAPGYVGRPLDGSQYIDVVEEQAYADQRPSAEEQKPRFSYLHKN